MGSVETVAIIGFSGRFPQARNVEEFWQNLLNGVEAITVYSEKELEARGVPRAILNDPNYVKAEFFLENVDMFDASFFGFAAKEAAILDPQQRLFLEGAWEALENAGYSTEKYDGLIGVVGGTGVNRYMFNVYSQDAQDHEFDEVSRFQKMISNDKDYLTTRVAYKLDLRGPSLTVQTACSTSLVAVHLACQSLLTYQCDIALAGGVFINLPQGKGYLYEEGMILSPDGHCRAFDANARGMVPGGGVGIVVLKRLSEALADGDSIHAVIKGSAINNDGALKVGYTAPSVEGQAEVIMAAQSMAQVDPETITYIETHGTGTQLGDPIEIAALSQAFQGRTLKKNFCAVGSVKTNIGHLDAAAGVTGLIKTMLSLKYEKIPPSLNFEIPNPEIDFDSSPFYVNTKLTKWESDGTPRRAGVSAFGIGGTNAHVILEEAPVVEPSSKSRPWQILLLSAKTGTALEKMTKNLSEYLEQDTLINLADVAYTLQVGRKSFSHRRMVVCQSNKNAVDNLRTMGPEIAKTFYQEPIHRDIVFMFSGQGSQYANMGLELYKTEEKFREEIDKCSEILNYYLNFDLRDVLYPISLNNQEVAEKLKQTFITQPALFVIEYALAKLWISWGIHPKAMIGHSIGEYVAACLAGVVSLEDALRLVSARGRLMQETPVGSMLAIPLPENEIKGLLNERLSLSVVSGPSLCVVSGEKKAIEALEKDLSNKNVNSTHLHTSHAFHSYMMEPILEKYAEEVGKAELNAPQIPFISNVTGKWITPDEARNPNYWPRHLRQTVRLSEGMQELLKKEDGVFLEVGPGNSLCQLVRQHPNRIKDKIILSSIRHAKEDKSDCALIMNSLGHLWLAGVQIDWNGFYAGERRYRISLPSYPFERKRYWIDGVKQVNSGDIPASGSSLQLETLPLSNQNDPEQKPRDENGGRPRNEIERCVADIWQELLGIKHVGIHDNFFDLGGSSLIAIRMLTQIEKAFGKKLPLATIFQAPRIEQLARMVDVGIVAVVKSSLVRIQEGRCKPQFFCMPGNLGNVFTDLGYLARHLDPDQPVYGLQDDVDHPSKVEALAAHFIHEIHGVQPVGPYFLGGLCFGGVVAFEMAQQLLAQGQHVALLALIEPAPPSASGFRSYMDLTAEILGRLLRRSTQHSRNFSRLNRTERGFYLRLKWKSLLNMWAWKCYVPQPYPRRIDLFLTSESLKPPHHPRLRWRELALGGAKVYRIPGTHDTITGNNNTKIEEAHMMALAKKLGICIDNAGL